MSTSSRNERAESASASNIPDGKVVIGRVSSPHGVRGELAIVPLTVDRIFTPEMENKKRDALYTS